VGRWECGTAKAGVRSREGLPVSIRMEEPTTDERVTDQVEQSHGKKGQAGED
jgi:hypothetical protein